MNPGINRIELLEALRKGNRLAVKEIYEMAFHYCASFILKNQGNMDDARDVFQEVLIVLFRNLHKEDFQINRNLKTYLYGTAKNIWLKKIERDRKRGLQLSIDRPESNFELADNQYESKEKAEKEQTLVLLEKALEEHSEECRQLLRLFFYEKKTYTEVARLMDYKESYIRNKKMKCIKVLRERLRKSA